MYEKAGAALKKFVSRFVSIEMGLCIFVGLLIFMLGVFTLI